MLRWAPSTPPLQPGDLVLVSVDDVAIVRAAAVTYLLPVAGLLAGALLAQLAGMGDGMVLLTALGGLLPASGTAAVPAPAGSGFWPPPGNPQTGMAEPDTGLVLYVREGCHLCEQFLMELSLEMGPAVELLAVVDVDDDPELAIRYGLRVPVLTAGADVLCEGVLDAARLQGGNAAIIARFPPCPPANLPHGRTVRA